MIHDIGSGKGMPGGDGSGQNPSILIQIKGLPAKTTGAQVQCNT
jgi:hypothetical protein